MKKVEQKHNYYKPRNEAIRKSDVESLLTPDGLYQINGQLFELKPAAKSKKLQIRPGLWLTKGGMKAKVFWVNPVNTIQDEKSDRGVIGAVEVRPGYWEERAWNHQGWTREPYGKTNDIIGEWSEG